jgi:uncharacterized protein YbjT (DUF2867 family)
MRICVHASAFTHSRIHTFTHSHIHMKILIIGSTGQVGREVVNETMKAGHQPVAAVRDLAKGRSLLGEQVALVHFDYADPGTFAAALSGMEGLFFIAPPGATDAVPVEALLDAAKSAGIRQVVFHSGRTTGDLPGTPLNQIEKLLPRYGLNYSILRPGWFMQNFRSWAGTAIQSEGRIVLPAGEAATAFVDVRDIGAAVARIFGSEGHAGKTYELTSGEALTHHEVAAILSEETGQEIVYQAVSEEEFILWALARGWKREAAEHTAWLYSFVRSGKEAVVSEDLESILGRKPGSFRAFAAAF